MKKKYIVTLTESERQKLETMLSRGKAAARKLVHARILLKADADGPAWTDDKISEAFGCRVQTVENVRKRCVMESFELALEGQKRETPPTPPILDGEAEAKVIAMRLGKPPAGYGRWTLRLLAEQAVELEIVESISHETIRRTLKKTA